MITVSPWPGASCAQSQDVREDALQLLDVLSERHWQRQQPGPAGGTATRADFGGIGQDAVIGSLPESWLQHQLRLSTKLARRGGNVLAPCCSTFLNVCLANLCVSVLWLRCAVLRCDAASRPQGAPGADGGPVRGANDAAARRPGHDGHPAARDAGVPGAVDGEPVLRGPLGRHVMVVA